MDEAPAILQTVKEFMRALGENDGDKAAALCAEDVVIELPGGETRFEGRDGVRRLVKGAPPFIRIVREEEVDGDTVFLRGLTRAPGAFANYTTWAFETDGRLITHVSFVWKPAN